MMVKALTWATVICATDMVFSAKVVAESAWSEISTTINAINIAARRNEAPIGQHEQYSSDIANTSWNSMSENDCCVAQAVLGLSAGKLVVVEVAKARGHGESLGSLRLLSVTLVACIHTVVKTC